jgi:hypothetical protein
VVDFEIFSAVAQTPTRCGITTTCVQRCDEAWAWRDEVRNPQLRRAVHWQVRGANAARNHDDYLLPAGNRKGDS